MTVDVKKEDTAESFAQVSMVRFNEASEHRLGT